MKKDLIISLIIAVICFVGGMFVVPSQLSSLQVMMPEQYKVIMASMPMPYSALLIVSSLQLAIMTFILSLIGIKLARKTGFTLPILDAIVKKEKSNFDKSGLFLSILFGFITALIITGADHFYYQYKVEVIAESNPKFSLLGLLAGVFYGGVFEEVLMRLFIMSFLIWLMMKIFRKTVDTLSSSFYWTSIIIAAVLFAVGHFPATEMLFGELTMTLIVRSLILNGIGGIFFGYLYWKKGFEYGIIAHMFAHIFMQLVFNPIF